MTLNRVKALMAAVLLVGGAAACTDLTGGTSVAADGVFSLQTINGNPLPFTFDDGAGTTTTIQSDTYALNTNGTYSEQALFRVNGNSDSYTESGFWTQSGSLVTLSPNQSSDPNSTLDSYQARVGTSNVFAGAKTLTLSFVGFTAIYSE
jgi:PKD repeat protein